MSLRISGRIVDIFDTVQIKENFCKRDFVIEIVQQTNTGMTFINYAQFQTTNRVCPILDSFAIGQDVTVQFDIRGNRWTKGGNAKYITNLNAYRIDLAGSQPAQSPYPPKPAEQRAHIPNNQTGTFVEAPPEDDLPF